MDQQKENQETQNQSQDRQKGKNLISEASLSEFEEEILNSNRQKGKQPQFFQNNQNKLAQQKNQSQQQVQGTNQNELSAQVQAQAQQMADQLINIVNSKKQSKKVKLKQTKDKLLCFGDIISLVTVSEIYFEDKEPPFHKKDFEWVIYDDGFALSDPQIIPKELTQTGKEVKDPLSFDQVVRLCLFRIENVRPCFQIPEEQKVFEEMGNEDEYKRVIGTPLTYGERITLRHIHSNGFLTFKYDEVAKQRGCIKVYVCQNVSVGSIFEIYHHQQLSQRTGIPAQYDIKFILENKAQSTSIKYYLNAHKTDIENDPNARVQVNAGLIPAHWQAKKFLGHDVILQPGILYSGDPVRMLHVEFNGWVTVKKQQIELQKQPVIKLTQKQEELCAINENDDYDQVKINQKKDQDKKTSNQTEELEEEHVQCSFKPGQRIHEVKKQEEEEEEHVQCSFKPPGQKQEEVKKKEEEEEEHVQCSFKPPGQKQEEVKKQEEEEEEHVQCSFKPPGQKQEEVKKQEEEEEEHVQCSFKPPGQKQEEVKKQEEEEEHVQCSFKPPGQKQEEVKKQEEEEEHTLCSFKPPVKKEEIKKVDQNEEEDPNHKCQIKPPQKTNEQNQINKSPIKIQEVQKLAPQRRKTINFTFQEDKQDIFLQQCKGAQTLWEIQRKDISIGGAIKYGEEVLIKHVASRKYLQITWEENQSTIQLVDKRNTPGTILIIQSDRGIQGFVSYNNGILLLSPFQIIQDQNQSAVLKRHMQIENLGYYLGKPKVKKEIQESIRRNQEENQQVKSALSLFQNVKDNFDQVNFKVQDIQNSQIIYKLSMITPHLQKFHNFLCNWCLWVDNQKGHYNLDDEMAVKNNVVQKLKTKCMQAEQIFDTYRDKILTEKDIDQEEIINRQNIINNLGQLETFIQILQIISERLKLNNQKTKIALLEDYQKVHKETAQSKACYFLEPLVKKIYYVLLLCIKNNCRSREIFEKYNNFFIQHLKWYKQEVSYLLQESFQYSFYKSEEGQISFAQDLFSQLKVIRTEESQLSNIEHQTNILIILKALCEYQGKAVFQFQEMFKKQLQQAMENTIPFFIARVGTVEIQNGHLQDYIQFSYKKQSVDYFLENNTILKDLQRVNPAQKGNQTDYIMFNLQEISQVTLKDEFIFSNYINALIQFYTNICLDNRDKNHSFVKQKFGLSKKHVISVILNSNTHLKVKEAYLRAFRIMFIDNKAQTSINQECQKIIEWDQNEIQQQGPYINSNITPIVKYVEEYWENGQFFSSEEVEIKLIVPFVIQLLQLTKSLIIYNCVKEHWILSIMDSLACFLIIESNDFIWMESSEKKKKRKYYPLLENEALFRLKQLQFNQDQNNYTNIQNVDAHQQIQSLIQGALNYSRNKDWLFQYNVYRVINEVLDIFKVIQSFKMKIQVEQFLAYFKYRHQNDILPFTEFLTEVQQERIKNDVKKEFQIIFQILPFQIEQTYQYDRQNSNPQELLQLSKQKRKSSSHENLLSPEMTNQQDTQRESQIDSNSKRLKENSHSFYNKLDEMEKRQKYDLDLILLNLLFSKKSHDKDIEKTALLLLIKNFNQKAELLQQLNEIEMMAIPNLKQMYDILEFSKEVIQKYVKKFVINSSTMDQSELVNFEMLNDSQIIISLLKKLKLFMNNDGNNESELMQKCQHYCRFLKYDEILIQILKIKYDEERHRELFLETIGFLYEFCYNSTTNQLLLYPYVDLFIDLTGFKLEISKLVTEVLRGQSNYHYNQQFIQHILQHCKDERGYLPQLLYTVRALLIDRNGIPAENLQIDVLRTIISHEVILEPYKQLSFKIKNIQQNFHLQKLRDLSTVQLNLAQNKFYKFHCELINLLVATAYMNKFGIQQCRRLISLDKLFEAIKFARINKQKQLKNYQFDQWEDINLRTPWILKKCYLHFLLDVYIRPQYGYYDDFQFHEILEIIPTIIQDLESYQNYLEKLVQISRLNIYSIVYNYTAENLKRQNIPENFDKSEELNNMFQVVMPVFPTQKLSKSKTEIYQIEKETKLDEETQYAFDYWNYIYMPKKWHSDHSGLLIFLLDLFTIMAERKIDMVGMMGESLDKIYVILGKLTGDLNKIESKNDNLDFSELICQMNNVRDKIPITNTEITITTSEQDIFKQCPEALIIFEKTLNIVKQYIIKKQITLRMCFEEFDADQNNFIDCKEFTQKIIQISNGQITQQELNKIVPLLDSDLSGNIDFQEFSRFLRRYFKSNPLTSNSNIYIKLNKQAIDQQEVQEAIQKSMQNQNLYKQLQEQQQKEWQFQKFLLHFQQYTRKNKNEEIENLVQKIKQSFLQDKKDNSLIQKILIKLVKDLSQAFRKPENKIYLMRILLKLVNEIENEQDSFLLKRIQQVLAECGVANMALEMISLQNDESLCFEAVKLLVKLLQNGNKIVQETLYMNFAQTKHFQFFSFVKQYLRSYNDSLNEQCENWQMKIEKQHLKEQYNVYNVKATNVINQYASCALDEEEAELEISPEEEMQRKKAKQATKLLILLQLLCENCYIQFQDFLRNQGEGQSIDLVAEVLSFGINLQYMDIYQIFKQQFTNQVYEQCFDTLIDFTTGPCILNQSSIGLRVKFYNLVNSISLKFNDLLIQLCNFYDQEYNKKNKYRQQRRCFQCFKKTSKVYPLSKEPSQSRLKQVFCCCISTNNLADESDFKNDKDVQILQRNLKVIAPIFIKITQLILVLLEGNQSQEISKLMIDQIQFDILIDCAIMITRLFVFEQKDICNILIRKKPQAKILKQVQVFSDKDQELAEEQRIHEALINKNIVNAGFGISLLIIQLKASFSDSKKLTMFTKQYIKQIKENQIEQMNQIQERYVDQQIQQKKKQLQGKHALSRLFLVCFERVKYYLCFCKNNTYKVGTILKDLIDQAIDAKQVKQLGESDFIAHGSQSSQIRKFQEKFTDNLTVDELEYGLDLIKSSYKFYAGNISTVEIDFLGSLQCVYFKVPKRCQYLTEESRCNITERAKIDSQQEKIEDFLRKSWKWEIDMRHQKELSKRKFIFKLTTQWDNFATISYLFVLALNLLLIASLSQDEVNGNLEFNHEYEFRQVIRILGGFQFAFAWLMFIFYIIEKYPNIIFKQKKRIEKRLTKQKRDDNRFRGTAWLYEKIHQKTIQNLEQNSQKQLSYQEICDMKPWKKALYLMTNPKVLYFIFYLILSLGAIFYILLYSFLLLDIVNRVLEIKNILRSVTMNSRQLLLTAVFALIIIYLFSIVAFQNLEMLYLDTKANSEWSINANTYCDTLWDCYSSTLEAGLRAGGGIGDAIAMPFKNDSEYWGRYVFVLSFFIVVNIILLNVIFGIIIDTFAALRDQRNALIKEINSNCFVCGIRKNEFDLRGNGWINHITLEHNIYSYLSFIIYIRNKDLVNCNGIEKYCHKLIKENNTSFIPRNAICLINTGYKAEEENQEEEKEGEIQ